MQLEETQHGRRRRNVRVAGGAAAGATSTASQTPDVSATQGAAELADFYISESERDLIKKNIIELMARAPADNIQRLVCTCTSTSTLVLGHLLGHSSVFLILCIIRSLTSPHVRSKTCSGDFFSEHVPIRVYEYSVQIHSTIRAVERRGQCDRTRGLPSQVARPALSDGGKVRLPSRAVAGGRASRRAEPRARLPRDVPLRAAAACHLWRSAHRLLAVPALRGGDTLHRTLRGDPVGTKAVRRAVHSTVWSTSTFNFTLTFVLVECSHVAYCRLCLSVVQSL